MSEENEGCVSTLTTSVGIAILALLLYILINSWPTSLYLIVSLVLWVITLKHRNKLLIKATNDFLLCTTIGLSLLVIFLALLNSKVLTFSDSSLFQMENLNIGAYYFLKEASKKLTLIITFTVIIVLLFLTRYFPNHNLIYKFGKLKKLSTGLLIILLIITSFTFFSYSRLKKVAMKSFERRSVRYHLLIRENADELSQVIAIEHFKKAFDNPDKKVAAYYKTLFAEIAKRDPETELFFSENENLKNLSDEKKQELKSFIKKHNLLYGTEINSEFPVIVTNSKVAEKIAAMDAQKIRIANKNTPAENSSGQEMTILSFPNSSRENNYQLVLVERQLALSEDVKKIRHEAMEGLKMLFEKMITDISPEIRGLIGTYVEEIISESANRFFTSNVEKKIQQLSSSPYSSQSLKSQTEAKEWNYSVDLKSLSEIKYAEISATTPRIQEVINYSIVKATEETKYEEETRRQEVVTRQRIQEQRMFQERMSRSSRSRGGRR